MITGHVHPINDLVEHELDDDCACGPTTEFMRTANGADGWIVVHQSLDGREQSGPERQGDGWAVTTVELEPR